jgi:hypothetical protein
VGSQTAFASSGFGTVFPVLKMFLYPCLVASIINVHLSSPLSVFLLGAAVGIPGVYAFLSVWRSELLLLVIAAGAGLLERFPRRRVTVALAAVVVASILLPFAHLKKVDYARVMADPTGAILESLQLSPSDRVDFLAAFMALRVNGGREVAYVASALDGGRLELRYGATYREAILQLVPRPLWSDKPSYNIGTNFVLARAVGLVGEDDPSTSWGVHAFAETVWNYGLASLMWAVPVAFTLTSLLDRIVRRWLHVGGSLRLTQLAHFFFFLSVVGFVSSATFVLWSTLAGKTVDSVSERMARATTPRE